MKKKQFIQTYGNLSVQLFNVSNNRLNFEGITFDGREILIQIMGNLCELTREFYSNVNYSLKTLIEDLSIYDISVFIELNDEPYMISKLFKAN